MSETEGAERRDSLAEGLWSLADSLGSAKIIWRGEFTGEERVMIDRIMGKLMRLGGQVKRGEVILPGAHPG